MKKIIGIVIFAAFIAGLFFIGCGEKVTVSTTTTSTTSTPTTSTTPTTIVITGNTYYVATNGNDSNSGTLNQPWRHIQYAADQMQPGDGVYIRGGTYHENVTTTASGAAGAYIIFAAYQNETPIIDGTNVTATGNGFRIYHSYIKLNGLHLTNWSDNAIWTDGAAHFEINNCEVYNVTYGIGISNGSHDFVVSNTTVHHVGPGDAYAFDVSPGGGSACYNGVFNNCSAHTALGSANIDGFALSHQQNQNNFKLNNCTVYNVFDGFDLGSDSTTLEGCSAYNCSNGGYKLWGDNVLLVNCIGYNSVVCNLEVDQFEDDFGNVTDTSVDNTYLRNCTFLGGTTPGGGPTETNVLVLWGAYENLHMSNCIIAGGASDSVGLYFYDGNRSRYTGDYNLFHCGNASRVIADNDDYTLATWKAASSQDANSIPATSAADIFKSSVSPFDLHLKDPGSPAIDKGTSTNAPSTDFDGKPRPVNGIYDIGAYEKQ